MQSSNDHGPAADRSVAAAAPDQTGTDQTGTDQTGADRVPAGKHAGGYILLVPDKFKGSLTAPEVAAHLAAGIRRAWPGAAIVAAPVADGGDGTVDAAVAAGYRRVEATVRGPDDRPVTAAFAFRDETAVIEAAEACGLRRLPEGRRLPLTATSAGVGDLIAAALAMGARRIVLGIGGVATTDGGAGMVQALGGRLLDETGNDLGPGGAALRSLRTLRLPSPASEALPPAPGEALPPAAEALPPAPGEALPPAAGASAPLPLLGGIEVLVASDVDNPLLGPHGAAAIYGPQKGASPSGVAVLEQGLARWAEVAEEALGYPEAGRPRDAPGAGAAGGLGFAAIAFLGAAIRPGIELLLELTGFARKLRGARAVITGEGSLDAQTLHGKAPAGVARAAAAAAVPVIAVSGVRSLTTDQLRAAHFDAAYALSEIEPDARRCLADAGRLVEKTAEQLTRDHLAPSAAAGPGAP
jgi:glycerate 2-kinase